MPQKKTLLTKEQKNLLEKKAPKKGELYIPKEKVKRELAKKNPYYTKSEKREKKIKQAKEYY